MPSSHHLIMVTGASAYNLRLSEYARPKAPIANGDLSAGKDRWSYRTDVDPPWHIHGTPVAVLFGQGWFGVLACASLNTLIDEPRFLGLLLVLLWSAAAREPANAG